ncbi:hypothetical protein O1611_g1126 [Lasiodiplodia mahajangana]|uniref:Uncharacterized protein n=1 Tax=Lasiodiplodia mahajangana TaxID=1108764 RepID=A0ACC2JYB4_9PEZI|nr:hypothetical protein O1611_g1126 [Lasiodiplodia mahajangana]
MELTPIRVRGKRRAGGELLPVIPRPKRLNRGQNQKKRPRVRRPKASNLEKSMPLEVLERIFWFSENVNFPRASPRLGRILSGPSTLRETFLVAFGPTWEVWFGCVDGQGAHSPAIHSYFGWEKDSDRFGGNSSFQTDLLACSWTTIDMILDCRDIWVRRYARTLPFEYIPLWGDPIEPSSYTGSGVTVGVSEIKEARCYFYHDYNAFRNIELRSTCHGEPNPDTWIEVHRSAEIPDSLITGPWDEGSLQKFFWLVQAGARLSPNQTWEVTLEGFHNAIADRNSPNLTVGRLLHILGAFREWPRHIREQESRKVHVIVSNLRRCNDVTLDARYKYVEWLLVNDS